MRLAGLGIYFLEHRRLRGKLSEVYNIIKRIDRDNAVYFPMVGKSRTRRHMFEVGVQDLIGT